MHRLFLPHNDKYQLSFFVHAALAMDCKAEHSEAEQHHGTWFRDRSGLPGKVVISALHGVMEQTSIAEINCADVEGCDIMFDFTVAYLLVTWIIIINWNWVNKLHRHQVIYLLIS